MPGKISGAHDGEDRHRLGGAVDRRAPLLAEQEEDRRDQRAGVADADPEDEVDDRPAPADRVVQAPDADAFPEQPADRRRRSTPRSASETARKRYQPRGGFHSIGRGDRLGDVVEVGLTFDQRRTALRSDRCRLAR